MKQLKYFIVLLLGLVMASSCSKSGVDLNINDPQDVEFLNMLPQDLVEAFGEQNIYFGHTPPDLEGISFKVKTMNYVYCLRYLFNPDPSLPPIPYHADPPDYDGSTNYHHFYDFEGNIANHKLKTVDPGLNTFIREDTVFVIGNTDLNHFTVYYEEELKEEGSGYPTNGILISGTLVYNEQGVFIGVKNYRIGKKILRYKERPAPNQDGIIKAFEKGTIEIKTHAELAPAENWDQ